MTNTSVTHDDHGEGHKIVPLSYYVVVICALFVLMFATVYMAFWDVGPVANVLIAIGIAVTKAVLIVLIFMNVYFSSRLTQIFVAGGFFWLLILFGLIIIDFLSREMVTTPQSWE